MGLDVGVLLFVIVAFVVFAGDDVGASVMLGLGSSTHSV